jgi:ribosomal protein L24E
MMRSNKFPLVHVPVALYTFGCCYSGHKEPYRTVVVEADDIYEARNKARLFLKCSAVEILRFVKIEPNPAYVEWRKAYRLFHGIKDDEL